MPLHRLLNAYMTWLQDRVMRDEKKGPKQWAQFKASLNRPPVWALGDPETRSKYQQLKAAESR